MPLRRPSVTLLFLQEKVGYQIAPSSDPASPAHLWFMVASPGPDRTVPRTVRPPRGRLWVEKNPASQTSGPRKGRNKIQSVFCTDTRRAKNSAHPESASFAGAVRGASPNFGSPAQRVPKFLPPPARPAGGRAVTGVGHMGRRPGKKEGAPPQGPPNQKRWVQGGRTSSSLVFCPPAFFQRKPGSPAGVGGAPGALRPKGGFRATHLEGTSPPPPQKINLQTSIFNSIIKSR